MIYSRPLLAGQASRALKVYQDAVVGGYVPRLHVLDRVLGCLRTPRPAATRHSGAAAAPFPFSQARFNTRSEHGVDNLETHDLGSVSRPWLHLGALLPCCCVTSRPVMQSTQSGTSRGSTAASASRYWRQK